MRSASEANDSPLKVECYEPSVTPRGSSSMHMLIGASGMTVESISLSLWRVGIP